MVPKLPPPASTLATDGTGLSSPPPALTTPFPCLTPASLGAGFCPWHLYQSLGAVSTHHSKDFMSQALASTTLHAQCPAPVLLPPSWLWQQKHHRMHPTPHLLPVQKVSTPLGPIPANCIPASWSSSHPVISPPQIPGALAPLVQPGQSPLTYKARTLTQSCHREAWFNLIKQPPHLKMHETFPCLSIAGEQS